MPSGDDDEIVARCEPLLVVGELLLSGRLLVELLAGERFLGELLTCEPFFRELLFREPLAGRSFLE
ncbi:MULTISPECIES: hypothetical protein [Bradyrhizobium]|uniref:hypothetical protein n=1 Tax=Bradyrhizobium TaxID=374 RepID=UPI001652CD2B|nr:hypothetical protein [Bradyrhizobium cytisi]